MDKLIYRALIFILMCVLFITACGGERQPTVTPVSTETVLNPPTATADELTVATEPSNNPAVTPESNSPPVQDGRVWAIEMNSFKDEDNYWYFHGLVRNDTDRVVYDVQVEISLYDSTDTQVYSYTTYTSLGYLEPGEISPFSDFTTQAYPDGMEMQAEIVEYKTTDSIQRSSLEFAGITLWADEYNDVYLAGVVTNGTAEPVEINSIAGTLTDDTGKIITSAMSFPRLSYIEPNGSSPFMMMFDAPIDQSGDLSQYQLYTDAVATSSTPTYDISISDTPEKYQDTNGDMHLVGSVTNNESEPLNIYLVAGLYDKDGNCIDANVVFLPMPLNPGETFPYDFSVWGAVDYAPEAYEAVTDYQIYVDWLATFEGGSTFELATEDDANAFDGSIGRFSGTVVNNSGQDLDSALVSVSLYDKTNGKLIATNLNFVSEALSKDANGTYEVFVFPPNDLDPQNIDIQIIAIGQ